MAIKKGICKNYGECSLADDRVIQEADSADFLCKECKLSLFETEGKVDDKKRKLQKVLIGLTGLGVIGGGTYAFLGTGSDVPETVRAERITLSKSNGLLTVGNSDTLHVRVFPEGASQSLQWASSNPDVVTVSNGVVTAVGDGSASVGVQVQGNKDVKAFCKYTVKADGVGEKTYTASSEKLRTTSVNGNVTDMVVSNGKYTGPLKNGKPHGLGTLVFTKTAVINSSDIKKRTAKPGESVQGQFVNGTFTIGKHYNANGQLIESLNFGVAN